MSLEQVYPQSIKRTGNAKGVGFFKTILLAGLVMLATPFVSSAATPIALYTNSQTHAVCGNLTTDVGVWLSVTDIEVETLTWTIQAAPIYGTLIGDGATALGGGSSAVPTGMIYTPDPSQPTDFFIVRVTDTSGNFTDIAINLTINAGPSLTLGSMPSVCAGVTSTSIPFSNLVNVGPDTAIVTTAGSYTFTVPSNVTTLKFDIMGASGGNENYVGSSVAGKGARVEGAMSVLPGSVLTINVGGKGGDGTDTGATGGFNGGGNAFFYPIGGSGGAGGGATDIRIGGTGLANRKVVAGGGAGSGADVAPSLASFFGGDGGGLTGGNSANNAGSSNAKGGTQTAGGAPATELGWIAGGFGTAGNGGAGSTQGISGGGGGGFYGGGGGVWTGGGGGSSYTDNMTVYSVTHTRGANTGDGSVKLYYVHPGTYTIIWDDDADTIGGFENVANEDLPTNFNFPIAVPFSAPPGTYHGTLTINNINCTSINYPISVTVKPLPVVTAVPDQVLCHGTSTTAVILGSSVSGSTIHWTSDNTSIFGSASSSGNNTIPSFAPVNATAMPATANITMTATANGCTGPSAVFQIVDNPIPTLDILPASSICNNTLFSYTPHSATPGTSFVWSRAAVTGISNAASTGTGNPNEVLSNTTINPIAVTYVYTLTASTCTNVVNVVVTVNPTPVLSSTLTPTPLCNNDAFNYTPASSTGIATLAWSRPVVAGISNPANSGTGTITETLLNTTTTPKTVTYVITMTVGGCSYAQNVSVTVNPPLTLTSPTALGAMCNGNTLAYGPVSSVPGATKTWTRAAVTGISNPAGSGTGNINEALFNTTPNQIVVTYVYTLSAFGCSNTQSITKTVNPKAKLSSDLTPDGICTNTMFTYTPTSLTPGATFQWARDNQPGISNPASPVLTGGVSEILVNYTDTIINVLYKYTTTAYGCANADSVYVPVFPTPRIVNDTTPLAICDSALFSFTPVSATPGASYAWARDYVPGILNPAANNTTATPNERLNNTTYISVPVTYVYTVTANGCTNTQNVIVQVRPSPILTHNTAVTCSGAPFKFEPVSYTTLTTFAWARTAVGNITPTTASGNGDIMDTLTSSSTAALVVTYNYNLTIFGCVNKQSVIVTVNPAPAAAVIGTHPNADICNGAKNVNFGAAVPAPDGYSYSWSATNATVYASGGTKQFAIVNFSTPGTATVTLTIKNNATSCTSKTNQVVNVGNNVAVAPEVIYFDRQFICKQNEQTSYQWGYDDKATLDSTILAGETNQNYFNEFPDFAKRSYWVITTNPGGCTQKTYFNMPNSVDDLNVGVASLKIFPNPTSNYINVEVNQLVTGDISFDVYNMLGQKLESVRAVNNKAQINVAELPAGAYLVDCYSDGVKVTAARFIKN